MNKEKSIHSDIYKNASKDELSCLEKEDVSQIMENGNKNKWDIPIFHYYLWTSNLFWLIKAYLELI